MSTYSPSLRLELITTGDQAGTWGNTTNTNLGTLIESGICGYVSVSVTSANQALTALNGAADQSRNMVIALTTTTSAPFAVYAPPAEKVYVVYNASGYAATIYNSTVIGNTTAAGAGVVVPAGKTIAVWSDGTNFAVQNNYFASLALGSLTLTTPLAVADGGTGAATAANARTNLGLGTIATQNANTVNITGGNISGITDLAIADGGTGQSTANGAFNALAPSQVGQTGRYLKTDGTNTAWDSIDISTSDISGTLPIANGGTAATTASGARSSLGLAIGTDVQAYNAGLQDISGLAKTNTNFIVANGTNWVAQSGATARTSLGLGSIATQNASSVGITGGAITGVSITNISDLAIADGGTGASNATDARTNLGLGSIATQNAYNVTITGGSITGITDLAVADGGTGASTAAGARTNLGLGTIATQNSNSVSITGGSITGITDLAVADGGTGASSFTSGGILRGNGTSALSVASSSDITAAIGSTAVTNATNATQLSTTNWTVLESGGVLFFRYGGVNKAKLDSSGNLTVTGNVTAYGTV